jgi:calcium-dependent protein kinase
MVYLAIFNKMGSFCSGHVQTNISSSKRTSSSILDSKQQLKVSKSMFVQENSGSFTDVYNLHPKSLGSGAYGEVWLCDHKITQETRAVKILFKEGMEPEDIRNRSVFIEVEILKALDHPNILKVYEYFEDDEKYYIVMEYCKNGDVFGRLEKTGPFNEKIAAKVMKQMLSALNYLHKQKIIHRDIKPENLLLADSEPDDINIKLIDFNIATVKKQDLDVQGTIDYMAPEVFKGNYDEKCDIWGAGVILYVLVSGKLPFEGGDDEEQIRKNILKSRPVLEKGIWSKISKECRDLIARLLNKSPSSRLSAEQALKHPFILKYVEGIQDNAFLTRTLTRIRSISKTGKLRQAFATFMVSQLSKSSSTRKLEEIFHGIDKNNDGVISESEMLEALEKEMSAIEAKKEAEKIFALVNKDENDCINYTEFLRISMENETLMSKENIHKAFKFFDKDGSGSIDKEEIVQWLGSGGLMPEDMIRDLIKEADSNGDGSIDVEEFENILIDKLDLDSDESIEDEIN